MILDYYYINGIVIFKTDLAKISVSLEGNHRTIYTPKFRSWDGINYWVEIIKENFNVDRDKAFALLIYKNERVLTVSDKKLLQKLTSFNPFKSVKFDYKSAFDKVEEWHLNYPDIPPNIFWYNLDYMEHFSIKNETQYYKILYNIEELLELLTIVSSNDRENLLKRFIEIIKLNGNSYEFTYLFSILLTNDISNKKILDNIVKSYKNWFYIFRLLIVKPHLLKEINEKYLPSNRTLCTIDELIRIGIKQKSLISWLSKKQLHNWFVKSKNCTFKVPLINDFNNEMIGNMVFNIKPHIPYILRLEKNPIPRDWLSYIDTINQYEWAKAHKKKLEKVRIIHGPNGKKAVFHYHYLLKWIDDDILINNKKTGWKKVYAQLEEKQKAEINRQLEKDFKLPMVHFKTSLPIRQISSSFELRDEGIKMGHCVGSYIKSCLDKQSYIFHYGNVAPSGVTFEIGRDYNNKFVFRQAYCRNNEDPNKKDLAMIKKFAKSLNK